MAIVRDLETVNAELQEQKERVENVDFKMITFSLAGKDYGVDIMNVKEIAKADKFTYVPNAASYVRGVYNLRGDIIPVIDLRSFFHLPVEQKENGIENMLILTIEERVYGTIVDKIDKVVGINSESIQPPHPIFGDINIKFISGVVEKQGDLYIILDGVRIFSISEDDKTKSRLPESGDTYYMPPAYVSPAAQEAPGTDISRAESALDFIRQSLPAIKRFYPSAINEAWLRGRFADWSVGRQGPELQLKDLAEADNFLARFYSPSTGSFWEDEYAAAIKAALPDQSSSSTIQIWNIGCGKGYETFSFACILKSRYPNSRFKIWANDNDIMAISQAPNMLFDLDEVPEYCRAHMVRGPNGYTFNQEIKDSILFEYHDVLNDNSLPDLDIILARDVLSFFQVPEQEKLVHEFTERLKSRGFVILGTNEELTGAEWRSMAKRPVSAFTQRE
ncbi:MAG: chemotaxis protein CheW [Spirochaetaceae bacterium]|jgi:purine-binding chemotaxis protein CheW|nr:chemotaxis protein CheW [Spirochaetaceae bacterium]